MEGIDVLRINQEKAICHLSRENGGIWSCRNVGTTITYYIMNKLNYTFECNFSFLSLRRVEQHFRWSRTRASTFLSAPAVCLLVL